MLNYLWAGMIFIGIIYAAFTGQMPDITDAAINSSKEAVTLCITMMGVMSFWVGLMEIANQAGIIEKAPKKFIPYTFSISGASTESPGTGTHHHKYSCKYSGPWLGSYSGRLKSYGSTENSGRRPEKRHSYRSCTKKRRCE